MSITYKKTIYISIEKKDRMFNVQCSMFNKGSYGVERAFSMFEVQWAMFNEGGYGIEGHYLKRFGGF